MRDKRSILFSKILIFLVAIMLIGIIYVGESAYAGQNEKQTIRIGYIDSLGFIFEKDGSYTGYGVDYLKYISKFVDWEYEFVYDTWENCLYKLKTGELDFVCMASKLEEREDTFIYSELSLGSEFTVIHVAEDMDIYYEEYEKLDGCKVGLLKGSDHSEDFEELAEEQGFSYVPVYYRTETAITEALEKGQVDAISIGSLYGYSGGTVVGKLNVREFYCMTAKKNTELMEKLNAALQHFEIEHRALEAELYEKYYGETHIYNTPEFTREEYEYIQNCEPMTVRLVADSRPLSYMENGEPHGLLVEYLNLLAEKSGLKFNIEPMLEVDNMDEYTRNMKNENYIMLRTSRVLEENGLGEGLVSSMALMETELAYVGRVEEISEIPGGADTFAVTREMVYLPEMLERRVPGCEIKYYDTTDECMRAVIDGEADIAIQDSFVVSYIMNKPEYSDKLVEFPGETIANGMCLIASEDNKMLFQVINKAINYISPTERDELVAMELLNHPYDYKFGDIIYVYWKMILCITVALVIIALFYANLTRYSAELKFKKKEYDILSIKVQKDEVTGVYNRPYFYKRAEEMIHAANEEMYIVMMDISRFKVVNDLYGMEKGNKVLAHVARELEKLTMGRDVAIARFTGDHFYMCLSKKDFEEISFPRKFESFLENMDIKVLYGVFVVEVNKDIPVNVMCDRANMAVHDKESKQVSYIRYYNEEERDKLVREQEIEHDMEKAIEEHQFRVYVQPKYDIDKGIISGGEALVRWVHPQKGMISPGEFISVFEKNGFIIHLDYYVWEETCRILEAIQKEGLPTQTVSINVSRAHFYSNEFIEKLSQLVAKYNLKPENLEIELTESLCAEDADIIYSKLRKLQALGFTVSMDDFGSGYSSLNMLKEMPLDIIKMDLKFLDGGEDVDKSRNILETLSDLHSVLSLKWL